MIIPSLLAGHSGVAAVTASALVPTASFSRPNLLSSKPNLGFVKESDLYKPPMLNDTTSISTARRVLNCKNDLRVKVGRRAKDKFSLHQTSGVGRNTQSIFPREHQNNLALLIPSDSHTAGRLNKLGLA